MLNSHCLKRLIALSALVQAHLYFNPTAYSETPDRVLSCKISHEEASLDPKIDRLKILFHGNKAQNRETADIVFSSSLDPNLTERHNCGLARHDYGIFKFTAEFDTGKFATADYNTWLNYRASSFEKDGKDIFQFGNQRMDCQTETPDSYEISKCFRGHSRSDYQEIHACEVDDRPVDNSKKDDFSKACESENAKEVLCKGRYESLCSVALTQILTERPYSAYDTQGNLVSCDGDFGEVFSVGFNKYAAQCVFNDGVVFRGCKKSGKLCSKKIKWPI